MDPKQVKEIVSIALAVIICGNELEPAIDIDELNAKAHVLEHRIDLVLARRRDTEALYQ